MCHFVQQGGVPAAVKEAQAMLIFGDSWAEDNAKVSSGLFAGVQGWPTHLAGALGLPVAGNFAVGQSESTSLPRQLKAAEARLGPEAPWSDLLAVLHSGGNDFIGAEKGYNPFAKDNFWLPHCTWGFRKKANQVIANLRAFLEELHKRGCRRFLVSDMPFTSAVPALVVAKVARVNKRGKWLTSRLEKMLADFKSSCKGTVQLVFVSEVQALNRLVAAAGAGCGVAARKLFLRDGFHPTHETHRMLAEEHATTLRFMNSINGRMAVGKGTERLAGDAGDQAEETHDREVSAQECPDGPHGP